MIIKESVSETKTSGIVVLVRSEGELGDHIIPREPSVVRAVRPSWAENIGNLIKACCRGRWVGVDVGSIDRDGDERAREGSSTAGIRHVGIIGGVHCGVAGIGGDE